MDILRKLRHKTIHGITTNDLVEIQDKINKLKEEKEDLENHLKCVTNNAFFKVVSRRQHYGGDEYYAIGSKEGVIKEAIKPYKEQLRRIENNHQKQENYKSMMRDIINALTSIIVDLGYAENSAGYFSTNEEQIGEIKQEVGNIIRKYREYVTY